MGVEYPNKISIREANTRFGSCNNKKNIMINLRLFLAPEKILDYVIIHELCHLVHLNHSKDFWLLVEKHCRLYKSYKMWLKQHALELWIK
ncbi:MAG: M48 family metallopeptidase [Armatimonadota bacterium]